ncbi:hypothetical protein B0H10DRAFT_2277571 [Mycena sp. CBHHK59/15]|nr:hypothetical protein B0H10DRAFT_2277571 [Mycena sp. CBHHK59/15]
MIRSSRLFSMFGPNPKYGLFKYTMIPDPRLSGSPPVQEFSVEWVQWRSTNLETPLEKVYGPIRFLPGEFIVPVSRGRSSCSVCPAPLNQQSAHRGCWSSTEDPRWGWRSWNIGDCGSPLERTRYTTNIQAKPAKAVPLFIESEAVLKDIRHGWSDGVRREEGRPRHLVCLEKFDSLAKYQDPRSRISGKDRERVWVTFHQELNNAARKPISLDKFLWALLVGVFGRGRGVSFSYCEARRPYDGNKIRHASGI